MSYINEGQRKNAWRFVVNRLRDSGLKYVSRIVVENSFRKEGFTSFVKACAPGDPRRPRCISVDGKNYGLKPITNDQCEGCYFAQSREGNIFQCQLNVPTKRDLD